MNRLCVNGVSALPVVGLAVTAFGPMSFLEGPRAMPPYGKVAAQMALLAEQEREQSVKRLHQKRLTTGVVPGSEVDGRSSVTVKVSWEGMGCVLAAGGSKVDIWQPRRNGPTNYEFLVRNVQIEEADQSDQSDPKVAWSAKITIRVPTAQTERLLRASEEGKLRLMLCPREND